MKQERDDRGFLQRMREKTDLQLPEELQIVETDDPGGEVFPVENPAEAMAEFFNNPKTY